MYTLALAPSTVSMTKQEGHLPFKVALVYAPQAVTGFARRHVVDDAYLATHQTSSSYILYEEDVCTWLQVREPGTLCQSYPVFRVGNQKMLPCVPASDSLPSHYLVPLEGGDFETVEPGEDLYHSGDVVNKGKWLGLDRGGLGNNDKGDDI